MTQFVPRAPVKLPNNFPVPIDDGQAAHLQGMQIPNVALLSTNNEKVRVSQIKGRTVVFVYVRSKLPGQTALYDHWDTIPGATICTIESCGFRDKYLDFLEVGAGVIGMSREDANQQKQAVRKLSLPFPLLTDPKFDLAMPLRLPMFEINEHTFLKRLTMIVKDGVIEHVFYPVFPPETHADEVLAWLKENKNL